MAGDKGRRAGGGGSVAGGRGKKSSPPVLSHEFFIQNHGDIVSCVIMLIMVGLMFNITAPLAKVFIMPQYNESITAQGESEPQMLYRSGPRDIPSLVFYALTWIAVHCAIQEYLVDKFQRRYNLSKTKRSKLSESIHLLVFAVYSVAHIGYILNQMVVYKDFTQLWVGYPEAHRFVTLVTKLFFVFQIAYWLHQFPEFYFQRLKREEIRSRIVYTVFFLVLITLAYFGNFHRLALVLLLLEYSSQALLNLARILKFTDRNKQASKVFYAYNVVFILARFATSIISVLTLWYGLRAIETPYIDFEKGNFNTSTIRLNALVVITLVQLYMLYNFATFHFGRFRGGKGRQHSKAD